MESPKTVDDARLLISARDLHLVDDLVVTNAVNEVFDLAMSEQQALTVQSDILGYWARNDANLQSLLFDKIVKTLESDTKQHQCLDILEKALLPSNTVDVTLPVAALNIVWSLLKDNIYSQKAARIITLVKQPVQESWSIIKELSQVDKSLPALSAWLAVADCLHSEPVYQKENMDVLFIYMSKAISKSISARIKICLNLISRIVPEQRLPAWNRYIALVGISIVDASSNQMVDALDQFAVMLKTDEPPVSWKLLLLEGIFKSNLAPIRQAAVDLALTLDEQHLRVLDSDPSFVSRCLLPELCKPRNFVFSGESLHCPYADALQQWTARLAGAVSEKTLSSIVNTFIQQSVIANAHCFIPPLVIVIDAVAQSKAVLDSRALVVVAKAATMIKDDRATVMGEVLVKSLTDLLIVSVPNLTPATWFEVVDCLSIKFDQATLTSLYSEDLYQKLESTTRTSCPAITAMILFKKPTLELLQSIEPQLLGDLIHYHPRHIRYLDVLVSGSLKATGELGSEVFKGCCLLSGSLTPELPKSLTLKGQLQLSILKIEDSIDQSLLASDASKDPEMLELKLVYGLSRKESWALEEFLVEDRHCPEISLRAMSLLRQHMGEIQTDYWGKLWATYKFSFMKQPFRSSFLEFIAIVGGLIHSHPELMPIYENMIEMGRNRRGVLVPVVNSLVTAPVLEPWIVRILALLYTSLFTDNSTQRLETMVALRHGVIEADQKEEVAKATAMLALSTIPKKNVQEVSEQLLQNPVLQAVKLKDMLYGDNQRTRILIYQVLLVLEEQWSDAFSQETIPRLVKAIDLEASTRARQYAIWLLARAGLRKAESSQDILDKCDSENAAPRVVSSLIQAALLIALKDSSFVTPFIRTILPFAASNKAAIRHSAMSAMFILQEEDRLGYMSSDSGSLVKAMVGHASHFSRLSQYTKEKNMSWDINDLRVGNICGGVTSRSLDYTESAPDCYLTKATLSSSIIKADLGLCYRSPHTGAETLGPAKSLSVATESGNSESHNEDQLSIQTKGDGVVNRTPLIVVASFCDKLPNLGGICRVCDALGAGKLVLNDTSGAVLDSREFKGTAMTAERWMPLEQVPEEEVVTYMLKCKEEGYTLVGIEQTDNSQVLSPALTFPEKTLLLLGREKLGIPGPILPYLDWCVEIEQRGVVRSMNVQTATAVLVHAYNYQSR